mmetsp:Transcript_3765/g.9140  ORF Transcript_3765/g.9140 Transcript_3765/m.9140 type:complete len:94 (+) Transcript_3765:805-1086(+)
MLSQFAIVDSLCAMVTVSFGPDIFSSAACTSFSETASNEEVASSSISTIGLRTSARAIAILCFCPPEMRFPRGPSFSSHPSWFGPPTKSMLHC